MRFVKSGLRAIVGILTVSVVGACASLRVIPVQNEFGSRGKPLAPDEAGVRFYRPALYVWITAPPPEKEGEPVEYSAKIVTLPDYSQEYAIQWRTRLGSVSPSFRLADGWNLTEFNSKADARAPDLIRAVTDAVVDLGSFVGGRKAAVLTPGLYRLQADERGILTLGPRVFGLE